MSSEDRHQQLPRSNRLALKILRLIFQDVGCIVIDHTEIIAVEVFMARVSVGAWHKRRKYRLTFLRLGDQTHNMVAGLLQFSSQLSLSHWIPQILAQSYEMLLKESRIIITAMSHY